MKVLLTLLGMFMASSLLQAQDSWRVVLNNKLVLTSQVPDEKINSKALKSSEWKKNGYLEVNYKEAAKSNWHHSIRFADEAGNDLLVKDSTTSVKILTSALRKKFTGKKQMKIYLVISPPDPMMAAPSRIIHLATLKLP